MQPSEVKTAAHARKIVEERKLSHVKLGVFDLDGVLRGKYLAREKFFAALDGGFGFCDVVLGWDSNDQLFDNVSFTGWHTAYPDAQCRIVPDTCRPLPLEGDMLFFLAELSGPAEALCPRGMLRRVLKRAQDMGYAAQASCEYEFFLFEETPHSVREKGYKNLKNVTPGFFGYSMLRASVHAEFYEHLLELCDDDAHAARRPPHRDRPRRARGRHCLCRRARRRRPRGPVQDVRQGAGRAPRLDGDLHGQVVARLAGPIGATCTSRSRTGRAGPSSTMRSRSRTPSPTGCAGSSADSRR